MKKILIPTDFSQNAGDALSYTLNHFKNSQVELHITTVVDSRETGTHHPESVSDKENPGITQAETSLEALRAFSKQAYGDSSTSKVIVTTSLLTGSVSTQIKKQAKAIGADLIVMGTQGVNHNIAEKIFGTVSTNIIENAPCPVVLVPKNFEYGPIENLLFTTNLNPADPYHLWRATNLLNIKEIAVRCLYVTKNRESENFKHVEEFSQNITEHSPVVKTIFNIEESKNVESTISQYADTYNIDLIVMQKSKPNLWAALFGSLHTKKMASWSKVPLLIMNT